MTVLDLAAGAYILPAIVTWFFVSESAWYKTLTLEAGFVVWCVVVIAWPVVAAGVAVWYAPRGLYRAARAAAWFIRAIGVGCADLILGRRV